jgi:hypothetical protein
MKMDKIGQIAYKLVYHDVYGHFPEAIPEDKKLDEEIAKLIHHLKEKRLVSQ